ncbi:unnamed protein product [Phaeothamnion confervicola]
MVPAPMVGPHGGQHHGPHHGGLPAAGIVPIGYGRLPAMAHHDGGYGGYAGYGLPMRMGGVGRDVSSGGSSTGGGENGGGAGAEDSSSGGGGGRENVDPAVAAAMLAHQAHQRHDFERYGSQQVRYHLAPPSANDGEQRRGSPPPLEQQHAEAEYLRQQQLRYAGLPPSLAGGGGYQMPYAYHASDEAHRQATLALARGGGTSPSPPPQPNSHADGAASPSHAGAGRRSPPQLPGAGDPGITAGAAGGGDAAGASGGGQGNNGRAHSRPSELLPYKLEQLRLPSYSRNGGGGGGGGGSGGGSTTASPSFGSFGRNGPPLHAVAAFGTGPSCGGGGSGSDVAGASQSESAGGAGGAGSGGSRNAHRPPASPPRPPSPHMVLGPGASHPPTPTGARPPTPEAGCGGGGSSGGEVGAMRSLPTRSAATEAAGAAAAAVAERDVASTATLGASRGEEAARRATPAPAATPKQEDEPA